MHRYATCFIDEELWQYKLAMSRKYTYTYSFLICTVSLKDSDNTKDLWENETLFVFDDYVLDKWLKHQNMS